MLVPVVIGKRSNTDLSNMKFLVLALCVCAASAASFNSGAYKPWQQQVAKAVARVIPSPVVVPEVPVVVAKSYVSSPVVPKNVYTDEAHAAIVRSETDVAADGYNYYYETGNGISAQSTGTLKKVDNSEVLAVQGSYQYVAPDGSVVRFNYVADENGYQPESDVLPVAPEIPAAILRSLEYIRAHPPKPEKY